MALRSVFRIALLSVVGASLLCAQSSADSARPPRGAELLIPFGSLVIPGLGQYIHKAPLTGVAYTGVAVGGLALAGDGKLNAISDIPHDAADQRKEIGLQLFTNAAWLSSWDAFHRSVPQLKCQGRYVFLPERESVGQLVSAPFDLRFLRRWTTWVGLANTAVVTSLVYSDREPGVPHFPLLAHDVGYATSLAGNAATGEEAWFRGYLLPVLYQKNGGQFWVANSTQAAIFSAAHAPGSMAEFGYRGAWGLWQGWLVRHDDWSVREAVFNHFWYDFAVVTAAALADEKPASVRIGFTTIRF